MKVIVHDNQIEKAIKDLKRKLTKEGFFSEIKERRFYDKPSVQRKKKQAKAAKSQAPFLISGGLLIGGCSLPFHFSLHSKNVLPKALLFD